MSSSDVRKQSSHTSSVYSVSRSGFAIPMHKTFFNISKMFPGLLPGTPSPVLSYARSQRTSSGPTSSRHTSSQLPPSSGNPRRPVSTGTGSGQSYLPSRLVLLLTLCLRGHAADLTTVYPSNITIGVMVSLTGPKKLGTESIAAINLTLQAINSSPGFEFIRSLGYQFQQLLDYVPCEPSDAFTEMMDIFSRSGDHTHGLVQNAFVGPSCDEVCQAGGRLAKYYDVMMVSFGCESTMFDNKDDFPTFGRTTPSFRDMKLFILEIITHYKWPRVTLVTMTTPIWQETMTLFEESITSIGVTVRRWSIDSINDIQTENFRNHLELEAANTRVYILLMYPEAVLDFMRRAGEAGLNNGHNVFVSMDYAGTHKNDEIGNATFLNGMLDVTYDVRPETPEYQSFLQDILTSSGINVNPRCSNYEYGIYPLLISDGMFVVAGAFNTSLAKGIPITRGAQMANLTHSRNVRAELSRNGANVSELTYNQTFEGLFNDIELDEMGTRVARFMLHNIQNNCYVAVARSHKNDNGPISFFLLSNEIIWPGGTKVAPLGRDKCGWNNELCPQDVDMSAIITGLAVGGVLLLLTLAFCGLTYFLWKRNVNQALLMSTAWLVEWEDIKWRLVDPNNDNESDLQMSLARGSLGSVRSHASCNTGLTSKQADTTVVYRCQVVRMDVEGVWAVKSVRKPSVHLTEDVKRELNLVRGLKHPNINTFVGACVKQGHVSLMWSYCPKGSLMDLIHSGIFKMEIMFQLSFAQDIAKGLAYLHNSDLAVHGRLKSSNIVVDSGLNCKLTDIGMPKFREGESHVADESDPGYWFEHVWTAPEHLREHGQPGQHASQKGDVYSYGIILFEIMFKRKPYLTDEHLRMSTEPNWQEVIRFVKDPNSFAESLLWRRDSIYTITEDENTKENKKPSLTQNVIFRRKVKDQVNEHVTASSASSGSASPLQSNQTTGGKACNRFTFNAALLPAVRFKSFEYTSNSSSSPSATDCTKSSPITCRLCCGGNAVKPQTLQQADDATAAPSGNAKTTDSPRGTPAPVQRFCRPDVPASRAVNSTRNSFNQSLQKSYDSRDLPLSSFSLARDLTGTKHGDNEAKVVQLMMYCWAEDPENRPSADAIIKRIRNFTSGRSLSDNIEQIMTRYSEQLEDTVNERTRRLEEEKAKYLRVLCEVIPQKYVGALVSGGRVEAESFPNVTIFFSDIVGFTSICGKCSPQEVLNFLNDLYTRFDAVLNSYNVYKVETIGDAYMVAAGIPEQIPDHAQQIAHMALHILNVSRDVKAPYVDKDGVKTTRVLKLRIGLNSGPVVAGIVGEKMPRYCLYGNTVNIASRMESNGKPYKIHMSKDTTNILEATGLFQIAYRGMISVKGKDNPVPTFWLINSFHQPFDLPDGSSCDED